MRQVSWLLKATRKWHIRKRPLRDEEALHTPGAFTIYRFLYPPVFLLLCAPLTLIPFVTAFIVFEATTLIFYLVVVQQILAVRGAAWCFRRWHFQLRFGQSANGQNAFLDRRSVSALGRCWSIGIPASGRGYVRVCSATSRNLRCWFLLPSLQAALPALIGATNFGHRLDRTFDRAVRDGDLGGISFENSLDQGQRTTSKLSAPIYLLL